MRKYFLLIYTTFITVFSYSQITFEKGYFINNLNKKIECFIKNVDSRNNPTSFKYKIFESDNEKSIGIDSVKEFYIYKASKYIRKTVKIDRSSNKLNKLSRNKKVILKEEQIFLKTLIEGEANLYLFEDGALMRLFYSYKNSDIEQLIFKNYLTTDNKIGENNRFKQQLWSNLKCSSIKLTTINKLQYTKKSLFNFFNQYNKCTNSEYSNFELRQNRDLFNLSIRPQFRTSSLSNENFFLDYKYTDFGSKSSFGLGIEAELILPFNKNKWALIFEPTYQYFKSDISKVVGEASGRINITSVKYNSIELPIGIRHYFFLKKGSKFFINTSIIIDTPLNCSIDYKEEDGYVFSKVDIKSGINLALGAGYKMKDRYSMEARFHSVRQLTNSNASYDSPYKTVSIILGYSFL